MTTATPALRSRLASNQDKGITRQLVTFVLAGEEYALDIKKVQEIILNNTPTFIPQSPAFIRGLINLRGNVIPVVDLRTLFGMPTVEATGDTRIIVVESRGVIVGLTVDAVNEVLRIGEKQLSPAPPTVANLGRRYLAGLVQLDKRLVILLNGDELLATDDLQRLDQDAN